MNLSNLDNIINKIKEDNFEKINIISNEFTYKKTLIDEEFDKNLKQEKEEILRKFEANKLIELERILTSIDFKCRNTLLNKKQYLINLIIKKFKNKLENMSELEFEKFLMEKLNSRCTKYDDEIIYIPIKYTNLEKDNIKASSDVKNGFIISIKNIIENYSFDTLIKFKLEEIEEILQKYLKWV